MITVAILINGNPIAARAAVNTGEKDGSGRTAYRTDSGETVWHDPDDGAVSLSKKLLDTVFIDAPKSQHNFEKIKCSKKPRQALEGCHGFEKPGPRRIRFENPKRKKRGRFYRP